MNEHFEALEASFQSEYGLDLRRAIWGSDHVGVRRIQSLISGLPPGSPLHRALEPRAWAWGTQEELLAVVVELADTTNRLLWSAHFKGSPPGKPIEITRPNDAGATAIPIASSEPGDLKAELAAAGRLLPPLGEDGPNGD